MFRMKARFKVQHQILSGLKYVQVVSRMGVKNKMQEMIVRKIFSPLCFVALSFTFPLDQKFYYVLSRH